MPFYFSILAQNNIVIDIRSKKGILHINTPFGIIQMTNKKSTANSRKEEVLSDSCSLGFLFAADLFLFFLFLFILFLTIFSNSSWGSGVQPPLADPISFLHGQINNATESYQSSDNIIWAFEANRNVNNSYKFGFIDLTGRTIARNYSPGGNGYMLVYRGGHFNMTDMMTSTTARNPGKNVYDSSGVQYTNDCFFWAIDAAILATSINGCFEQTYKYPCDYKDGRVAIASGTETFPILYPAELPDSPFMRGLKTRNAMSSHYFRMFYVFIGYYSLLANNRRFIPSGSIRIDNPSFSNFSITGLKLDNQMESAFIDYFLKNENFVISFNNVSNIPPDILTQIWDKGVAEGKIDPSVTPIDTEKGYMALMIYVFTDIKSHVMSHPSGDAAGQEVKFTFEEDAPHMLDIVAPSLDGYLKGDGTIDYDKIREAKKNYLDNYYLNYKYTPPPSRPSGTPGHTPAVPVPPTPLSTGLTPMDFIRRYLGAYYYRLSSVQKLNLETTLNTFHIDSISTETSRLDNLIADRLLNQHLQHNLCSLANYYVLQDRALQIALDRFSATTNNNNYFLSYETTIISNAGDKNNYYSSSGGLSLFYMGNFEISLRNRLLMTLGYVRSNLDYHSNKNITSDSMNNMIIGLGYRFLYNHEKPSNLSFLLLGIFRANINRTNNDGYSIPDHSSANLYIALRDHRSFNFTDIPVLHLFISYLDITSSLNYGNYNLMGIKTGDINYSIEDKRSHIFSFSLNVDFSRTFHMFNNVYSNITAGFTYYQYFKDPDNDLVIVNKTYPNVNGVLPVPAMAKTNFWYKLRLNLIFGKNLNVGVDFGLDTLYAKNYTVNFVMAFGL